MFREMLGLEEACSLSGLLNKAHPYINYDVELLNVYKTQGAPDIDEL